MWTTGASVRRYSWLDGEEYDEALSLEPGAVRLERLNLGAPFLDTHCSYALENVIGSVVPGTAKIADGRGTATIKLSKAAGVADTVQKIQEGVIRNISVGYWIHKVVKTEGDEGTVARWDVVDWEPLEVSAVPIPADPGSQIRSEGTKQDGSGPATRSCTFVTKRSPAPAPKPTATKETRMAPRTRTAAPKSPKGAAKRLAELEAENLRLTALVAAKRDDDKKDDEERDGEDDDKKDDEERDGEDADKKDDKEDDEEGERDGEESDEEDDADEEDDKRSAASSKSARAAANAAVKAERERSAEITALAERAGLPKLGRKHIDKGTSARAFKAIVLERMLDQQARGGKATIGTTGARELGDERSSTAPNKEQREIENGAAHWRKVAPSAGKGERKADKTIPTA